MSAYTRQKAKSKHRNRIRLERASQNQSIDTHRTPCYRVKQCWELWSSAGMKVRGSRRSPSKPADQRHRPARFPLAKIRQAITYLHIAPYVRLLSVLEKNPRDFAAARVRRCQLPCGWFCEGEKKRERVERVPPRPRRKNYNGVVRWEGAWADSKEKGCEMTVSGVGEGTGRNKAITRALCHNPSLEVKPYRFKSQKLFAPIPTEGNRPALLHLPGQAIRQLTSHPSADWLRWARRRRLSITANREDQPCPSYTLSAPLANCGDGYWRRLKTDNIEDGPPNVDTPKISGTVANHEMRVPHGKKSRGVRSGGPAGHFTTPPRHKHRIGNISFNTYSTTKAKCSVHHHARTHITTYVERYIFRNSRTAYFQKGVCTAGHCSLNEVWPYDIVSNDFTTTRSLSTIAGAPRAGPNMDSPSSNSAYFTIRLPPRRTAYDSRLENPPDFACLNGFSRGSPDYPAFAFRCYSIFARLHFHRLSDLEINPFSLIFVVFERLQKVITRHCFPRSVPIAHAGVKYRRGSAYICCRFQVSASSIWSRQPGATVAERLACSPPTEVNLVQCPASSLLDDIVGRRVFSGSPV
ncbi:hypothetical protein PR048_017850 [Dryococelus australis]|uniref:Uncharacterized protein n=1 Tax=Dryococelus australis TaxID=614101 RepID=A0ABQ9HAR4_9NEOP|nr:hypothetical protein PR048_017850 [Dryococelus australis]